jgi:hypothetical protein
MLHRVRAMGFEPTNSSTRSKRSFLNYCTLVEELNVARRYEAQTTPSRRRSALIDEAERSSAPFALKIGGGSGIGRDSGSDAGELQYVLTQSCSDIDGLNCYWRNVYDECRRFEILNGGGLLTLVPCVRKSLQYNQLQHKKWRRRELHPRPEKRQ